MKKSAKVIGITSLISIVTTAWTMIGASYAKAETRQFSITIKGGKVAGDSKVIRVDHHDIAVISWTSDKAAEIHLHGYDKLLKVNAGKPATIEIRAFATGRFPFTMHGHGGGHGHAALAHFEVVPE